MDNESSTVTQNIPDRQNDDGLWKTKDVAAYLQIGVSTVYKWVDELGLPTIRIGGATRYDPDAVKEWARQQAAA